MAVSRLSEYLPISHISGILMVPGRLYKAGLPGKREMTPESLITLRLDTDEPTIDNYLEKAGDKCVI